MFKGFMLKISGGYLSEREQEEPIKFVLEGLRSYPRASLEVRMFLDEAIDELSSQTTRVLQDLARKWRSRR